MIPSFSPTVTVITPTRNRRTLLAEAMASVEAQTFTDWEHLIIDDGSDDGSLEMVAEAAARDVRVRLLCRQGEQRGGNVCRNLGLREAQGEFVLFLDSDDLLASECLEGRVALMRRNVDLDFAVFLSGFFIERIGDRHVQKPEERFGDDLLRILTFDLPWIITAPVWRRRAIESLGGFDESLPSWQDVDLHLRAVCCGMCYLKRPVIDHHIRWQFEETKVSVMQRRSPEHLRAAEGTLVKFERYVRAGPGLDWSRERAICGLYFELAECWVEVGELREGLRCWRLAAERGLASVGLSWSGTLLLAVGALIPMRHLADRLIHKWKGRVRFRLNMELVT